MNFIKSFIDSYMPPNYSAHGQHVDNFNILGPLFDVHTFCRAGAYFIYTLFKFRQSKNPNGSFKE